jgi:hypothetical protein
MAAHAAVAVGDWVQYQASGNTYKGPVIACWGPEQAPAAPFAYPNNCRFTVKQRSVQPDSVGYVYPIDAEIMVHRSNLVKIDAPAAGGRRKKKTRRNRRCSSRRRT